MRSVMHAWVVGGLLLAGSCLGADQSATAPAVTLVKDGDTLVLGEREYVVKVVGGAGQRTWTLRHAEDGTLTFWHDGKIVICDPKEPALKEMDCTWRLDTLSASRNFAVVNVTKVFHDVQFAVADLSSHKLVVTLPENVYGEHWVFSPGGRIALPLEGSRTLVAADLKAGQPMEIPFPKLTAENDFWTWSGFVMADGKTACVFLHSDVGRVRKYYRAMIPLDDPAATKFEESADAIAVFKAKLDKDNILVAEAFIPGEPQMMAVVSTKNWQVQRRMKERSPEDLLLEGTVSPDGKWSYSCDRFRGLTIFDRATGETAGHTPGRDGWSFNAETLGVTFDDTGSLAMVGSPYDGLLTVLSTKDHALVGRYGFKNVSPAGALVLPPEKAGGPYQLIVVNTFLPYE